MHHGFPHKDGQEKARTLLSINPEMISKNSSATRFLFVTVPLCLYASSCASRVISPLSPFINNLKRRQDTKITHQSLHLKTSPDSTPQGQRVTEATQEDTVTFETAHTSEAVYNLQAETERRSGRTGECQGQFPKINPVRIRKDSDRNMVTADFCCSVSVSRAAPTLL